MNDAFEYVRNLNSKLKQIMFDVKVGDFVEYYDRGVEHTHTIRF